MKQAFKIGWKDSKGKYRYIVRYTKADALGEAADKLCISDYVSIRKVSDFKLEKEN